MANLLATSLPKITLTTENGAIICGPGGHTVISTDSYCNFVGTSWSTRCFQFNGTCFKQTCELINSKSLQSPIVCATTCLQLGGTKLFQQGSTRLGVCGTGDNYAYFGPNNDDSWTYIVSINNSAGMYFHTNQGNFLFDGPGHLGSYDDGEVDVGFSGKRFRCGYFSSNICGNCFYGLGMCSSQCVQTPIVCATTKVRVGNVDFSNPWDTRLKLCGSGDNYMVIGPANDNGWGYIESVNNSNGIYFGVNQGGFSFDTGHLKSYTDGEVDVGVSGGRFRCGHFSHTVTAYCLNATHCAVSPIVCATTCLAGKKTILDSSGDYVWCATCTAATYSPRGISTSFVRAAQGWQNYGTVLHVGGRGGSDAGGDFQLYMGHGHNWSAANTFASLITHIDDASPSDSWTTCDQHFLIHAMFLCGGSTHVM